MTHLAFRQNETRARAHRTEKRATAHHTRDIPEQTVLFLVTARTNFVSWWSWLLGCPLIKRRRNPSPTAGNYA